MIFLNFICIHYYLFLKFQNVSIGIVGKDRPFTVLDEEETGRYLALVEGEERRGGNTTAYGSGGSDAAPGDSEETPDPTPTVI